MLCGKVAVWRLNRGWRGMIFLLFSIACSVSIAHVFKYAEQKMVPTFALLAINYLVGSIVAFVGCDAAFARVLSAPLLGLGSLLGGLFVLCYILMVLTIKHLGVTIPVSLMRLSAVLPTFGSIMFFAEVPRLIQLVGIVLAFLSLPLASKHRLRVTNLLRVLHNGFGWGLMLFGAFGVTNFLFKIQREVFPLENPYHFLAIIFSTAFLVSSLMVWRQGVPFSRQVIGMGAVLGVLNLFSGYFFMKALQGLPGMVVYPINGIGIILVSAITSMVLWKERLTRNNYVFILLASCALLLIYPR
ncbi:hypothetical protein GF339_13830 [candidate division KSB3 bacterium]|uniref:EamA domain-containing protein n=1 Tax=candidate division KSB3 bacterium TaxID=2044937 RepID=A0A9D5JWY8_9BACT|nr:hypothetical protein [candidate division KSB3 bacterium]MBD3325660.1 hypothetical protein [candidate division KSB3 bacterium]